MGSPSRHFKDGTPAGLFVCQLTEWLLILNLYPIGFHISALAGIVHMLRSRYKLYRPTAVSYNIF